MRKIARLFATTLLVTLLAALIATPAFAAVSYEKKQTVYMNGANEPGFTSINVDGLTAKQSIAKSSIKVSNSKVMVATSVSNGKYKTVAITKDGYSGNSTYASINLKLKKAGTSKLTFKVGSKSYSSTVVVKNYANPVKSLTITGVKSGKNLASAFKKSSYASGKATGKKGKIVVKAASGWKITNVDYSNSSKSWDYNCYNGVSSAALNVPVAMKSDGYVAVSFKNIKTGGYIHVSYTLN